MLVGPRQVGKTVALMQTIDELLDLGWPPGNLTYFDFSDPRLTAEILPTQVAETTTPHLDPQQPRALLFDEISRAVHWDLWLKNVVDRGGCRVAVTDSASSLLRAGTRESGQGRWDQVRIEGLGRFELRGLPGQQVAEHQVLEVRSPGFRLAGEMERQAVATTGNVAGDFSTSGARSRGSGEGVIKLLTWQRWSL